MDQRIAARDVIISIVRGTPPFRKMKKGQGYTKVGSEYAMSAVASIWEIGQALSDALIWVLIVRHILSEA